MPQRKVHGLRPDLADVRDKHFRTDHLRIGKFRQTIKAMLLPKRVDLRNEKNPPIYDQGDLGSCTAQATAGMLGHLTNDLGYGVELFSRLFMYGNARSWSRSDDGAMLRDVIKGVDRYGVPMETMWPHDLNRWQDKPPQAVWDAAYHREKIEYFRLDTLHGMRINLYEGFPFIFGIAVYPSFRSPLPPDYLIPMPGLYESPEGGHALCMMGYDDDKQAMLFRNSWGDDWGDKGYGWLPYKYVTNPDLLMDAWTVRSIPE